MRNYQPQKSRTSASKRPKPLALIALVGTAVTALLLAGCTAGGSREAASGGEPSTPDKGSNAETTSDPAGPTPGETSTTGETTGNQQPGEQVRQGQREGKGNARVVVRVQGDPGISFSGTCRVAGSEETLEGETPQRYSYRLRSGQAVNCEVRRTDGEGTLALNVQSGNRSFNQESNGDDVTLRANMSASAGGSSSSSVSSSSSTSSVRQSSQSSSSSGQSSSSQSSSSSINVTQDSSSSSGD